MADNISKLTKKVQVNNSLGNILNIAPNKPKTQPKNNSTSPRKK